MLLFPKSCRVCHTATLLLLYSGFSVAADAQQVISPPTPFSSALQMLFGLGIVLLLIAGGAWLLKRLSDAQFGITSDIKVVSAVAVGPKERVVLVDIGETRVVLGVAPGHVNKLMEMPRPEHDVLPNNATSVSFIDKLKERLIARGELK